MNKTIYFKDKDGVHIIGCVDIDFKEKDGKQTLSICGTMSNCAGQCYEELGEAINKRANKKTKKLWAEIYDLWDKYHLNDMHSGTKKQEQWLIDNNIDNWASDYSAVCDKLFRAGLLFDTDIKDYPELKDCLPLGYKFGTKRLYRPIPFEDKVRIIKLFGV